ncbi:NAD(P)-dependent oxidoreductase [Nocardioides sp. GY 10113]|uniref:NmrA family NAD(P)-binding protein n=1 Tax=Nocardioides sp. GY 10113 TaxID=2569761 RepID=UPI0010A793C3|nr:NmrA family NAD(P)-binding protein [Nocardioides sp. GY 10113]TIC80683.1 NAD(P)-dependent oxidoreductase [Nocardioides sp. GY 10113]
MTVVVTGATGHLGALVVRSLLDRGVAASDIVATGRRQDVLFLLSELGVRTAVADFDRPETLGPAFAGADTVLLISASEVGKRLAQHRAAIAAAVAAGVTDIVYTSIANADTGGLALAAEHVATEGLLAASGLRVTLLRNGWYIENHTDQIAGQAEYGVIGAAADGRFSSATRADYAEAAAAVLADPELRGRTYELGGDTSYTLAEYAAWVGEATGRDVQYTDLGVDGLTAALESAGVPTPFAQILADSDAGAARGALEVTGHELAELIGRPTTSPQSAIAAAL